jgi:hypothetical protein
MLYNLKIKVTSPWLGDIRRAKDTHRRFQRGNTPDILAFDLPRLYWTLEEARDALKLPHVDIKTIRMEEGFRSPTLTSYRRRFSSRQGTQKQEDFFEAIRENTLLNMQVLVTRQMTQHTSTSKPPTQEELSQIFKFVGAMLGLSPWGGHFGYGRFELISLEPHEHSSVMG